MMLLRLMVFVMCAASIVSCTHTHEVGYGMSQTDPQEMLRSVTEEEVTITLGGSASIVGTILSGSSDSILFQVAGTETSVVLPIDTIRTIELGGTAWGPVVGFVLGLMVGGHVGAGLGQVESGSLGLSAPELAGAALGGFLGLIAGAVMDATERYELPPGGMRHSMSADVVTIVDAEILRETDQSVTISWKVGTTTLPKSRISIQKKGGEIYIRAPRSLLYDGDSPRYIDDSK